MIDGIEKMSFVSWHFLASRVLAEISSVKNIIKEIDDLTIIIIIIIIIDNRNIHHLIMTIKSIILVIDAGSSSVRCTAHEVS